MPEHIEAERERIVIDIANVEQHLANLQQMIAARHISPQRAELVSAQCNDELRRLTVRLADLDASISMARAVPEDRAGALKLGAGAHWNWQSLNATMSCPSPEVVPTQGKKPSGCRK